MSLRASSIALVFAAACSDQPIAYLMSPPLAPAKTVIAAVHAERDKPDFVAARLEDFEVVLSEPSDSTLQIVAVGLEASLEELGIAEGPLESANDGVALGDLPRTAILQATYRDRQWVTWSEVQELPGALAALRLPRAGCSAIVDQSLAVLDESSRVLVAAELDDARALLVTRNRAIVYNLGSGVEQSIALGHVFGGGTFVRERRRIVLAEDKARGIYALDIDTLALTMTASIGMDAGLLRFLDSDGERTMIVSVSGNVLRVEGAVAELVGTIDVAGPTTDAAGVSIISGDDVLLGSDNNPDLFRFDGNAIRVELPGLLSWKGFVAIKTVPMLGPIAVELRTGIVHARPATEWIDVGQSLDEAHIVHVVGAKHFFLADDFGRWLEFHPLYRGGCGINASNVLARIEAFFQLQGSIYGAGGGASGKIEIAHLARLR